jgi:hypothetical protein
MTTSRIDIDNLDTAATRALAEVKDVLQDAIATRAQEALEAAEKMTSAELKDFVVKPANAKPTTKADWIKLYVYQESQKTAAAATLKKLQREAGRDQALAEKLNGFLDDSDTADHELRELVNGSNGRAMYAKLRWQADSAAIAQLTATRAVRVLRAVEKGDDLRDAVLAGIADAMEVLFEFPSAVLSNGLSSMLKADYLMEALAAERFRSALVMSLDRAMPITIDMIKP